MNEICSVDEILDFAIKREEEANQFYNMLASNMKEPRICKIFEDFAREELGHKAKLENMKKGKVFESSVKGILDLKIADYLIDVSPNQNLSYQESLILAMKREKASFKLYNDLASITNNLDLRITLLSIAQEEAKHKLKIELEYDEKILTEN